MTDELHKRIVDDALTNANDDIDVQMTGGELILYHTLLQDYGLALVDQDRFIPLLERNMLRLEALT